ncbi:MAG: hypothetical protein Q7J84_09440, partial [Sulfuricaulis sp.]|nr:hypothetical protein [Sulfuricaulis sp.]
HFTLSSQIKLHGVRELHWNSPPSPMSGLSSKSPGDFVLARMTARVAAFRRAAGVQDGNNTAESVKNAG